MNKIRLLLLLLTFLVVGIVGTLAFLYAKGFRLNPDTREFTPNGILVLKSNPDSAQILINGELKTVTNATLTLLPDNYDIVVKKEGFLEWKKRLTIEKEVVTEATAHLFKSAPSLSAITFAGATDPTISADLTKIAYIIAPTNSNGNSQGLWIMETINLPLGFAREPRRLTDAVLTAQELIWSPDGREILVITPKATYRLDTGAFTSDSKLVNVAVLTEEILAKWQEEKEKHLNDQIQKLPVEMHDLMNRRASQVVFSADEEMVIYTASKSAEIPENLIKQLPGSSTQKQERNIKEGQTYIYDIKEDRNFLITEGELKLSGWIEYTAKSNEQRAMSKGLKRSLSWYPSSRHLILAEENKIIIMDYDGTNRQVVYSGSYIAPHAYPTLSLDRLLILTNLGATDTPANLYSLSLK